MSAPGSSRSQSLSPSIAKAADIIGQLLEDVDAKHQLRYAALQQEYAELKGRYQRMMEERNEWQARYTALNDQHNEAMAKLLMHENLSKLPSPHLSTHIDFHGDEGSTRKPSAI